MRFERDDGFGLITALMIAFVVFILAALWYAIGTHEIDEATEDRVSTAAINAHDSPRGFSTVMVDLRM